MNLIYAILFFLLIGFLVSSISGAPWVPARKYDVEVILDDVKLQKNEKYLELGCGDGRFVRAAARRGAVAVLAMSSIPCYGLSPGLVVLVIKISFN
jgi:hypothetical protein